ncbi:Tpr domain-containing protein [Teratosphaeria destructans]|uniref:Tpr domain-containing protein n=1 Tax=Teratosphaeria destructans TaxID=418781 RepID=A0A9W7SWL9_9PEZI|nr:Tpr domain-containing protein [Teratosphaeria destructans]
MIFYANILYQNYIIKSFHKFPEPVAKKLRKALYFTNTDLQPQEAMKFYRQALQVAEELEMDPFSDEIMGVKIQIAKLCEDVRAYPKAIQVLEILRNDSLEFLKQFGDLEHNKVKRTRVLGKVVAITNKLGELYARPEIYDRETAEERLVWAVETTLKEQQRRNNIQEAEKMSDEQMSEIYGQWMTASEIGAALESLAHNYEEKDQHYLAAPLFLQALSLYPTPDCHSVVLMGNLASALAQQSPRAAAIAQQYASSQSITNPTPSQNSSSPSTVSRERMILNARTWAQKALDVAAGIQPPARNEECDVGCAVATHNLGEFAEMLKDVDGARRKYEEALSLSRAIGFQDGVEMSEERLRALGQSKAG